jgi:16S rRNA (uracil1498-N3)-methyltransferase
MIPNSHQFHIPSAWVQEDAIIIPLSPLYRQLRTVLRVRAADMLRLFNGIGGVFDVRVEHVGAEGIVTRVVDAREQNPPQGVRLALAFLKNDRWRFALEKAVELGASAVVPMITERTVKRPDAVPARWEHIVREAAEQCGRAWLPTLEPVATFAEILKTHPHAIVCAPEGTEQIEEVAHFPCTVLIGPEGGFTNDELLAARAVQAPIVSLGTAQLRADTAALAALVKLGA